MIKYVSKYVLKWVRSTQPCRVLPWSTADTTALVYLARADTSEGRAGWDTVGTGYGIPYHAQITEIYLHSKGYYMQSVVSSSSNDW